MPTKIDLTIAPSNKYHEVIGLTRPAENTPETDEEFLGETNHHEASEAYIETLDNAPTPEEMDMDEEDLDPLSWDDISPSSDPDLLSKIATYFDGMDSDEPADVIRAKCRLLDVDIYANAQMAARAELRRQ